ncbi:hypothetical protein A3K82_03795 [Candidatus Pacearchaeota archaeon RBG_19FT_COMBO_34_9]|nr:MAG: hypothetical protein A3K82_03795 [Candidatus Pacearchaeota archaeon RBG_19FT_COMBO_34_9]OGJ16122.1 MAG: hypothetical protein A3K74_02730 [Candidatus Pacearchaeota archaeon RBG_13_33_26]
MNLTETKKLNAVMILEVLGRPPEHLVETLENLAKQMGEEKGVKIMNKKINSPVLMKEQKDFYTSFAEIEVETEDLLYLAVLMFKYMPAHIEILSPQNIFLANTDWNDILNELTRRLHGYEEITRILQTERIILENKLKTIMGTEEDKKEKIKEKKEEDGKQEVSHSNKVNSIRKKK